MVFLTAAFSDLSVLVNRFHRGVGLRVDVDLVDHRPSAGREGAARGSQRPNDRRSLRVRDVTGEELTVDVNANGAVVEESARNGRSNGGRSTGFRGFKGSERSGKGRGDGIDVFYRAIREGVEMLSSLGVEARTRTSRDGDKMYITVCICDG